MRERGERDEKENVFNKGEKDMVNEARWMILRVGKTFFFLVSFVDWIEND